MHKCGVAWIGAHGVDFGARISGWRQSTASFYSLVQSSGHFVFFAELGVCLCPSDTQLATRRFDAGDSSSLSVSGDSFV
jgi:hypothetical protein